MQSERSFHAGFIAMFIFIGASVFTFSQVTAAATDCSQVAQELGHGEVLWWQNAVIVQGTAAPDLSKTNQSIASIKRFAKKAATLDAYRKAAGLLAGVRITSQQLAADSPRVVARIDAFVRNAQVCKSKFYADGGVDMVLMLPLTGAFAEEQLNDAGSRLATNNSAYGSLIVDASHLPFSPALIPRILGPDGTVLFDHRTVPRHILRKRGAVVYEIPRKRMAADLSGSAPLRVVAQSLGALSPSDLVVDAKTAKILAGQPAFLSEGRVVVLMAPFDRKAWREHALDVADRKVDWVNKIVIARGKGRVDFSKPLDTSVRMRMMERAAEVDAQRKLMETLLSIRVDGDKIIRDTAPNAKQLTGLVLNAVRCDARYFKDGTAEVVLAAPLDGLFTGRGRPLSDPVGGSVAVTGNYSGLVVDASGLGFRPVLQPLLAAPNGDVIYGPDSVARAWGQKYGVAGYRDSATAASMDLRVGDNPLVVRAIDVSNDAGALFLSDQDSRNVEQMAASGSALQQARVLIVARKKTARSFGRSLAPASPPPFKASTRKKNSTEKKPSAANSWPKKGQGVAKDGQLKF